ncbi:venom allergen 3-like [Pogonomyrmex barbatus]|uniref:Venom allergen 3-like n=1 Tax=Pogonomyrmex barbatus TaxID=144034 RepID=A0A6I9XIR3_9HYME|nr:venom allergen 3-like [Pogonomyrmex barbatus]
MEGISTLLCFAIIVGKFIGMFATDYCNVQSCANKASHTLCKYTSTEPAAQCTEWSNRGFNDAQKKIIVKKHNELRRKVASGQEKSGRPGPQPAAKNMPDLKWDDELEKIAQRWADQCNFSHDECRDVDRFSVGQNIAMSSMSSSGTESDETRLNNMIQMWYNEVKMFDRNQISNYKFDVNTGHYTQLVWAKTRLIGCGRISYKKPNDWKILYLVCNYGPSGNYIGEKIYEIKK